MPITRVAVGVSWCIPYSNKTNNKVHLHRSLVLLNVSSRRSLGVTAPVGVYARRPIITFHSKHTLPYLSFPDELTLLLLHMFAYAFGPKSSDHCLRELLLTTKLTKKVDLLVFRLLANAVYTTNYNNAAEPIILLAH